MQKSAGWEDNVAVEVGDTQGLRLWNAAASAVRVLEYRGFRLRDAMLGHGRGASVVIANDTVAIMVDCDWYERVLAVSIQVAGAEPVPVENLVTDRHGALRLLPRNATRGVLQRRLELIVQELLEDAPEVLDGGDQALERIASARGLPT